MRRGFTILELLVATLLLGVIVTILTMIFNQSSSSWRIGIASVSDMDDIRDNMAELREEADNAFALGAQVSGRSIYRVVGLWNDNGNLRDRACDAPGSEVASEDSGKYRANLLNDYAHLSADPVPRDLAPLNVGNVGDITTYRSYTVNVMSGGPANDLEDWQAIWSFPDDPNEW